MWKTSIIFHPYVEDIYYTPSSKQRKLPSYQTPWNLQATIIDKLIIRDYIMMKFHVMLYFKAWISHFGFVQVEINQSPFHL